MFSEMKAIRILAFVSWICAWRSVFGHKFYVIRHFCKSHTFLLSYICKTFYVYGQFLIQDCFGYKLSGCQIFVP